MLRLRRARQWQAGFAVLALALPFVVSRCDTPPQNGDGGAGACPTALITPGDPCTQRDLVCPYPGSQNCSSFVCDGSQFGVRDNAGPGASCSQKGLSCPWPGTECDTCTCDGTTFQCKENCCVQGCNEAGAACPASTQVAAGQSCTTDTTLTCVSSSACDAGATGACSCVSGRWACQCIASPITLASGEYDPRAVAVDGTSVYWTDNGGGTVRKLAIDGGFPQTLASGQALPSGLAVDATNVYWANADSPADVMKVPLDGGTAVSLAPNQYFPYCVAVDATNVYWGHGHGVSSASLDGGPANVLVPSPNVVYAIAVDANDVYWTSGMGVFRARLDGGSVAQLASGSSPTSIALDATTLYWTDYAAGSVMKMALGSTTPVTLAAGQGGPIGIAIDATTVYWTNNIGRTVAKVSKSGGTPVVLAAGQDAPVGIAVDATNVYWTNAAPYTGTVMTTAK